YGTQFERSWDRAAHWVDDGYVRGQIRGAFEILRRTPFVPAMDWWLAIAAVPVLRVWRHPVSTPTLIWALGLTGYFLVAWAAGPGFAPFRTPHTFAPLVVLAGAIGLDQIFAWLHAWLERGARRRARALLVGVGVVGLYAFFLPRLPVLQSFPA